MGYQVSKSVNRSALRAAIAAAAAEIPAESHSHFLTEWRSRSGRLKGRITGHRKNLTTDAASGFTNRRDWQAKAMGGGLPPVATMTGTLTGTTATSATNTGAAFPTAGQALAGCIVVVGPNATGTGAISWGIIMSNTATVLTVDQWYSGGTWATGTTPNATGLYTVLPGQAPAMWLALTSDATTPSSSDTTLAAELTTGGFTRQIGVWAHTAAATTYSHTSTFTATATATINKECVAGSAVSSKGVMPFESLETSPPTLVAADTLQQVVTITVN